MRGGLLYKQIDRPTYSEILRLLARRTYDESGDYTVNPFVINVVPYDGATGSFKARISPGKAYVKGFEIETIATEDIDIPKARDYAEDQIGSVPVTYGNYVTVRIKIGRAHV